MPRDEEELLGVTLLGEKNTKYKVKYDPTVLETFNNKHQDNDYMVTFKCPEFYVLRLVNRILRLST